MRQFIEYGNTWITRDGRKMHVAEMDNSHLVNTIRMLYRNGKDMQRVPVLRALLNELVNRGLRF